MNDANDQANNDASWTNDGTRAAGRAPERRARIAAVVLNYRTPELVERCLATLAPQLGREDVAVVVDNASGDGSAARLRRTIDRRGWRPAVGVVESPVNGGFAAGMNLGCRVRRAQAYLLLNSDTELRPQAVERLWDTLRSQPRAGIVSPRLEWDDGGAQPNCFRFHNPGSELVAASKTGPLRRVLRDWDVLYDPAPAPLEPDWTSFAAVLIRGRALEETGPLDEGFFLYYEDVDYCRRLRQSGWTIRHEPRARVVHHHSRSSGIRAAERARQRRPAYLYESRGRYFRKAYGAAGPLLANLAWAAGRTVSLARERVGSKRPHTVRGELVDQWRPLLQGIARSAGRAARQRG